MLVWVGTITFAVTGALVAIRKRFDIVGVLILSSVTAIGGGSVRDLVAGVIPPSPLTNEALLWAIATTAVVVFIFHRFIHEGRLLYLLDTLGLAVFAALGAARALEIGFGFWGTVVAGVLSGVGGGIIRDVLSGEVPGILYRSGDLYATAAAAAAAIVFLVNGVNSSAAVISGVVVALVLRLGSRVAGMRLPVPRSAYDLDSPDAVD
jgi:uncharacterized membrane protein YeiH